MNPDFQSLVQQGFVDFLESTTQLQELLAQEVAKATDPAKKETLGQFLGLMRTTQAELQQVYPGEVEAMVQGLQDAEKSFSALEQKKDRLLVDLENLQSKSRTVIQQAEATRAKSARSPKPPAPVDEARQRLAAMVRRHGSAGPSGHAPMLQDGPLLQSKLLGILQPKPDFQAVRAKAIGNIWEDWPKNQAESPDPPEEN
jgi:hypothetical protein